MKQRLLTTVIAIAALTSGAAMAQPDHQGDKKPGGAAQGGQHAGGSPGAGARPGPQGGQGAQGGQHGPGAQGGGAGRGAQGGQPTQGGAASGRGAAGPVRTGPVFGGQAPTSQGHPAQTTAPRRGAPTGGRGPATPQTFGAPMRSAGGAHAPSGRQFQYRGQQRQAIQRGGYRYPSGWGYRRWNNGQLLPLLFLSQSYFFSDYYNYGFGPPPYGYVWVRYGPDLLLVNRRTGRIRDVVYGVFY